MLPDSNRYPQTPVFARAVRERAGLSQSEFARELNVSTKLVQAWEGGRRHPQGAALKLLQLAADRPDVVFEHPDLRRARAYGIDIGLLRASVREACSGDPWKRVLAMSDSMSYLASARRVTSTGEAR